MASQDQALILEPAGELRFRGPFSDVVTADLKLSNPTERRICFKVKTTAPKRYCVRPNSGILEPKASIAVAVMLQPFNYDPNEKNKHKFMVQSMYAPDHATESQELLWKDAPPESLMDTKLRCVFELPVVSHQQTSAADANKSTDSAVHYADSTLEEPMLSTRKVETQSPKKSSPTGDEVRKLQHELKKTQNEIAGLKIENSQLKDEGVRLRKVAMTDTITSTPLSQSPVPTTNIRAFPPVVYVLAAIILGLLIGKFLL